MPLPYISLGNFRAFREKNEFSLAPITILTGANSAGKSSLVDGVRILKNYFDEVGKDRTYGHSDMWKSMMELRADMFHTRVPGFEHLPNYKVNKDDVTFEFKRRMSGIGNVVMSFQFRNHSRQDGSGVLKTLSCTASGGTFFELVNNEDATYSLSLDYGYLLTTFRERLAQEIRYYDTLLEHFLRALNFASTAEYIERYEETNRKGSYNSIGLTYILKDDKELHAALNEIYPELLRYHLSSDTRDYVPSRQWPEGLKSCDDMITHIIPLVQYIEFMPSPDLLRGYETLKTNFEEEKTLYYYFYEGSGDDEVNGNKEVVDEMLQQLMAELGLDSIDAGIIEERLFSKKITYNIQGRYPEEEFDLIDSALRDPIFTLRGETLVENADNDPIVRFFENALDGDALNILQDKEGVVKNKEGKEIMITDVGRLFFKRFIHGNITNSITNIRHLLDVQYIPSIRNVPDRFYTLKEATYFEQVLNDLLRREAMSYQNIRNFMNQNLKRFGIGDELVVERDKGLGIYAVHILKDGRKINLSDLGYGISQLLPILVKICADAADRMEMPAAHDANYNYPYASAICIVEEPETNLHPALQSKLADMLVMASRMLKIQFIVETHSEYLIRRLQGMVVEKIVPRDKVRIYYFNHPDNVPEGEEQVYPITIEKDGALSRSFGKGFFDEAANLNVALYNYTKEQHN